jgi:hypothetical protein
MKPQAVAAVFRFEWNRTLTVPRMAWWLALVLFPSALVVLIRTQSNVPEDPHIWPLLFLFLIPGVVCLMGLLLWATPAIQTELEGKTWTYLAVRPGGKTNVLVGKYLTAVSWTLLAGWMALALAVILASPPNAIGDWIAMAGLVLLSCMAYGAVFLFIGVLFRQRPMIVALVYTIVFEVLLGNVPAMINELTVQYRLRTLLIQWLGWTLDELPQGPRQFLAAYMSDVPPWQHVAVLVLGSAALLSATAFILRQRELVASEDD